MASRKKSARLPSPRCGPSRNGTRPTSTVIWPRTLRRTQHLLLNLKAQGKSAPSQTDFVSGACDAAAKPLLKKHGIVLPPDLDFSVTEK